MSQDSVFCYHCGLPCSGEIQKNNHFFCCFGCLSVYEILGERNLDSYYQIESYPGKPGKKEDFSYLDDPGALEKFALFIHQNHVSVSLEIPAIHCASCVYLLEHLYSFLPGVLRSEVNFPHKKLVLLFDLEKIRFSTICEELTKLGYRPKLYSDLSQKARSSQDHHLLTSIGISGFCLGNIMLFTLPEYLSGLQVPSHFLQFFRYASLVLSLPVLFYCAKPWFQRAFSSIKRGSLVMEVPITLGLSALFLSSIYAIISHRGQGYLDSLAGFVFLLLLAQYFQEHHLFHHLFRGKMEKYIPLAVNKVDSLNRTTQKILVENLQPGDRIQVCHQEVIPVDSKVLSDEILVDFSFMTGEEKPVLKKKGQKVWAGGVLLGKKATLEVLKPLHESFFANLWKKSQKGSEKSFSSFLNQISPYFTVIVLLLSLGSLFYWGIQQNWSLGFYTFSSVLIVACPCGIALSGPFTHGFLLRLLSKEGIYLPSGRALDELARIRHLVFDKTGTLTVRRIQLLPILEKLTEEQKQAFLALASQSFHPVSQGLIERLRERENSLIHDSFLQEVKEIGGKGIQGLWKGKHLAIGKLSWLKGEEGEDSRVGLKWEKEILGIYEIQTCFRKGLEKIIPFLSHQFTLHVLTGDGEGDKEKLIRLFPPKTPIFFHCTPEEKRRYILHLMKKGPTAMIGDGINDSAALSASNAAIVIMEENAHFMPDADCAIESSQIFLLPKLFKVAQKAKKIIIASLCLSLIYNGIGLYYAFHGWLSPLFLGILMPLSSLSIMIFTCFMSYITYLTIFGRNDYGSALSSDSSQSFSCSLVSGNFYSSGSERPV